MAYRTTRPLALEMNHGGPAAMRYPFVLPAGSLALLVPGLDGVTGDGFAVGDTKQLAELTGNAHDAAHRWTRIPANAVTGETGLEYRTARGLEQDEAQRAAEAAAQHSPARYLQAFVIVLECGRVALASVYATTSREGETLARGQVLDLAGEGAAIWDCAAFPVGDEVRSRGPLVDFLHMGGGAR